MHIIFLILKIIGIILAVILGLILLIIGLVLLVPIRYRAEGAFGPDAKNADIRVTYLLRIIGVYADYEDNRIKAYIRILHFIKIPMYPKNGDDQKETAQPAAFDVEDEKPNMESELETSIPESPALIEEVRVEEITDNAPKEEVTSIKESVEPSEGNALEEPPEEKENPVAAKIRAFIEKLDQVSEKRKKAKAEKEERAEQEDGAEEKKPFKLIGFLSDIFGKIGLLFALIGKLFINILLFPIIISWKISDAMSGFTNSTDGIGAKLKPILEEVNGGLGLLKEEPVKHTIALCKKQLLKLLKHYIPRKISGRLLFGLEDPSLTGQIYGGYCVAARWHKYKVRMIPDFENSVIDGDIMLSGHIRLVHVLAVGIRLLLTKDVRISVKKALHFVRS